jgi:hypothetical protein
MTGSVINQCPELNSMQSAHMNKIPTPTYNVNTNGKITQGEHSSYHQYKHRWVIIQATLHFSGQTQIML